MRKRNRKSFNKFKRQRIFEELLKFDKAWLLIPLIFYSIGFFIHNIYLSQFSTFDFEILQTKYIYVGVLFTFYITVFIFFLVFGIGDEKEPKNPTFLTFTSWAIRPILISVILQVILFTSESRINSIKKIVHGNILLWFLFFFTAATLFIYFLWFITHYSLDLFSKPKVDRIFRIFFSISIIPILYTLYLFYQANVNFQEIMKFIWTPFIILSILFPILIYFFENSLFSKSKFITSLGMSLILIFLLFFLMIAYSKHIYPNIPSNFGGAKPTYAIIYTKKDTINCKIYNENSEWLLIKRYGTKFYERLRNVDISGFHISNKQIFEPAKPKNIR